MKILFYTFLLLSLPVLSQTGKVGIGTTEPTATLDINGNMRIRTTPLVESGSQLKVAKDSVLVVSNGIVSRVSSKNVYESHIKTAIRGSFPGTGDISIMLGSQVATIPFNSEDFDENNEFNTTTHVFTAKQDGFYQIYVQINSSGALAASTNYGLRILKGTVSNNYTVVAEQNFLNLSVLGINVTPPIRNVQTSVLLTQGEHIKFQLFTDLLGVSLLGSKSDSFFTIHQIR